LVGPAGKTHFYKEIENFLLFLLTHPIFLFFGDFFLFGWGLGVDFGFGLRGSGGLGGLGNFLGRFWFGCGILISF
jgi:hypothetical protein